MLLCPLARAHAGYLPPLSCPSPTTAASPTGRRTACAPCMPSPRRNEGQLRRLRPVCFSTATISRQEARDDVFGCLLELGTPRPEWELHGDSDAIADWARGHRHAFARSRRALPAPTAEGHPTEPVTRAQVAATLFSMMQRSSFLCRAFIGKSCLRDCVRDSRPLV